VTNQTRALLTGAVLLCVLTSVLAQSPPASTKLKDEMRQPWQRSDENFLRWWLAAGPFKCTMDADCLGAAGTEGTQRPTDGLAMKGADGASANWHRISSYSDAMQFDDFQGPRDGAWVRVSEHHTRKSRQGDVVGRK
jgi:hypothetical protein